jgi:hypothetical protein
MNAQAKRDLSRFARRVRASLRQRFRMVFGLVRMSSLGRRPEVGRPLAEADTFALEIMRTDYPGFTPDLFGSANLRLIPEAATYHLAFEWEARR